MPATMVWKISTCFDRLGGSEQVSILFPGAEAPEHLQQLRRRPEGRLYPNIDLFRVSLNIFTPKSSSFFPGTEVATHLLSLTGGLFKKANKWLRSPSFKVGQPRPSSSAFEYMRGP